ncbi:MAG: PilZ domain-containing protein [Proteobacteria bacterium]|nr:PilZ domain-containing protein [Pseudomonadota bacterium]
MPIHERRQHFRIEDQIYFEYKIIEQGEFFSDEIIKQELLGQNGKRFLETTEYFQIIDYELAELTQTVALQNPAIAHYLNLLNSKIEHLTRHLLMGDKIHLRKVNISLGGMAFKTKERIKENTHIKIIIYTKPKMFPIIVDAHVVYSQFKSEHHYHTAVQFESLDREQEQLLSEHIILSQIKCRAD